MVLRAIELGPEDHAVARGRYNQIAANCREVAEEVDPQQGGQVKGGLAEVVTDVAGRLVDPRFVRGREFRSGLPCRCRTRMARARGWSKSSWSRKARKSPDETPMAWFRAVLRPPFAGRVEKRIRGSRPAHSRATLRWSVRMLPSSTRINSQRSHDWQRTERIPAREGAAAACSQSSTSTRTTGAPAVRPGGSVGAEPLEDIGAALPVCTVGPGDRPEEPDLLGLLGEGREIVLDP